MDKKWDQPYRISPETHGEHHGPIKSLLGYGPLGWCKENLAPILTLSNYSNRRALRSGIVSIANCPLGDKLIAHPCCDIILIHYVDGWHPWNFGGSAKRIGSTRNFKVDVWID